MLLLLLTGNCVYMCMYVYIYIFKTIYMWIYLYNRVSVFLLALICVMTAAQRLRERPVLLRNTLLLLFWSASHIDIYWLNCVCRTDKRLKFCKLPRQIIICRNIKEADFTPFKKSGPACPTAVNSDPHRASRSWLLPTVSQIWARLTSWHCSRCKGRQRAVLLGDLKFQLGHKERSPDQKRAGGLAFPVCWTWGTRSAAAEPWACFIWCQQRGSFSDMLAIGSLLLATP